ncbi:MAG: alpha-L-rhamnosidase N-terminal domain-containing protein, partial [Planctomycetota bacterium]
MRGQLVAILLAAMLMVFGGCTDPADSPVSVKELRCEYRVNPAGIDVVKPRLNWIQESSQRGRMQSAYQVLVAGSEEKLKKNQGDLWDTGKVNSDESTHVVYAGSKLKSRMRCCWKVRVWDKDGRVSAWSKPASWTMGLLDAKDRQAKWIGYDKPQVTSSDEPLDLLSLEGCKWVWFPEGEPQKSAPVGTRFFRRRIEVPSGKNIKLARFRLVVDNEGTLFVNGQEVQKFSGWKPPYTFDITERLKAGTNTLAITTTNKGNTANPAGLGGKMVIEFEAGDWANIRIDHFWKASDIEQEDWEKPDFDDGAWANAKELVAVGEGPWGKVHKGILVLPPPPYLRKVFSVEKPVKRAVIYASALGLYELHINGKRVGKDYFTPGWTDYTKRVYYQTYDVTNLLARGGNAIGAILADGWYAGYLGFGRKREHYGSKPRLFVQLEIEYDDGSRQTVVTDKSWKAGYGPHLEADFLMGEIYDGRKEMAGWDTAGFDDSGWDAVALTEKVEGKVQSYPGVTVRETQQIKPVKRTEPKKGAYVFDMGQNFAGWVRLKIK